MTTKLISIIQNAKELGLAVETLLQRCTAGLGPVHVKYRYRVRHWLEDKPEARMGRRDDQSCAGVNSPYLPTAGSTMAIIAFDGVIKDTDLQKLADE